MISVYVVLILFTMLFLYLKLDGTVDPLFWRCQEFGRHVYSDSDNIDQFETSISSRRNCYVGYRIASFCEREEFRHLLVLFDSSTSSRWLEAYCERTAGLKALRTTAALADVNGDGCGCFVAADDNAETAAGRMRVYKGTTATDVWLPDFPTALIAFYTDRVEPRIPAIAVASGSNLYIYKNNKPFFKYSVPSLPITTEEAELWKAFFEDGPSKGVENVIIKGLSAIQYNLLSTVGQEIISEPSKLDIVLGNHGINEFTKENFYIESPIACMTTLKKSTNDVYDVCCPVLATASGNVFILDPVNFSVLYQANANRIKSTPFLIAGLGIFNVQYRLMTACRERHVSLLRKDWLEGKTFIQTMNTISDLIIIPDDGFLVIATVDKLLHCYTKKGHKLWSIKMAHLVTCLCLIPIRHLSITLTAVGLKNGTIQIYHGRKCVDQTSVPGSPAVTKFGQLGQEENALITVTTEGTVIFRILKRTAEFQLNTTENLPLYQSKPLPLPKRSALFLEQSMREQQTAHDIHQCFQQDLIKFRLNAARELMKSELNGSNATNLKEKIKISAQVLGMGPKFELVFNLDNMEESKPMYGLKMVLHVNPKYYECSSNLISIPLIPPGSSHKVKLYVEDKLADPGNNPNIPSVIRVFIIREGTSEPVLAALINMPPMEPILTEPAQV